MSSEESNSPADNERGAADKCASINSQTLGMTVTAVACGYLLDSDARRTISAANDVVKRGIRDFRPLRLSGTRSLPLAQGLARERPRVCLRRLVSAKSEREQRHPCRLCLYQLQIAV